MVDEDDPLGLGRCDVLYASVGRFVGIWCKSAQGEVVRVSLGPAGGLGSAS